MRDRVNYAVDTARPYVERMANDEELHDHVKKAYESARKIYDDLLAPAGATAVAMKVARDKDVQDELRNTLDELRQAGRRARGEESHGGRNFLLLLIGVAIGVLFNPMTGPETRGWLKEKVFGPDEPFEFESGSGTNSSNES